MVRFRYLCIILLVALTSHSLKAQDDALKVGLRVGHNVPFGWFEAASLETNQTFGEGFSINGGVQYSTMERIAIEARPTYTMHFPWGRLSAEVLMTYTRLSSINNMAVGGGAWVDYGRMNVTLGYYYRLYGGRGGVITEPFNMYYALRVRLLQENRAWNVHLTITNNEIFELERHYQPSFMAECFYYPTPKWGISLGVGCKPAGIFNISSDYYQSYLKTGVCYKW